MSAELRGLFERTLPTEHVIMRRMSAARSRRARARALRPWTLAGIAFAGLSACLAIAALLTSSPAPPLRAEAERSVPSFQPKRPSSSTALEEPVRSPAIDSPPRDRSLLEPSATPSPPRFDSKRTAAPAPTTASSAPALPPASWEAAARALREGDQAEAQRLLAELSKSDEPEVRDSALLVRLRSARSHLSTAEQAQLETLARSGATASIRSDARKLLEEVRAEPR